MLLMMSMQSHICFHDVGIQIFEAGSQIPKLHIAHPFLEARFQRPQLTKIPFTGYVSGSFRKVPGSEGSYCSVGNAGRTTQRAPSGRRFRLHAGGEGEGPEGAGRRQGAAGFRGALGAFERRGYQRRQVRGIRR